MQLPEYKVDSGLQAVCHLQPVLRASSHTWLLTMEWWMLFLEGEILKSQ